MRRNSRVTVNTRRGPGLVGTMAQTAVIAGTATVVSNKTNAAMNKSAQASQMQQQAQVQAMVDQELAARDAQAQQAQLQQQLAEQQAQMQAMMQQMAAPPPAAPAAPAASPADMDAAAMRITKLKELASLRDAGILSEAEFENEKARILAG